MVYIFIPYFTTRSKDYSGSQGFPSTATKPKQSISSNVQGKKLLSVVPMSSKTALPKISELTPDKTQKNILRF